MSCAAGIDDGFPGRAAESETLSPHTAHSFRAAVPANTDAAAVPVVMHTHPSDSKTSDPVVVVEPSCSVTSCHPAIHSDCNDLVVASDCASSDPVVFDVHDTRCFSLMFIVSL